MSTRAQRRAARRLELADLAVLAVLFLLGLIGFQQAFGGVFFLITGVVGLLIGGSVSYLAARRGWGVLPVTLLLLLAYVLLGTPFAAPARANLLVLPSPASLQELATGVVTSWKGLLTMAPPVGISGGLLLVPWISTLVLSALAVTAATRGGHRGLALLFPLILLVESILFGTRQPVLPVVQGVLFALVGLAWLAWHDEARRLRSSESTIIPDSTVPSPLQNPVLRSRLGTAVVVLAGTGILVGAGSPLLDTPAGQARYAVRDTVVPPLDPQTYPSPLVGFRDYLKTQREETVLTVSGADPGDRLRVAALDRWDAQVYNVAGSKDPRSATGAFLRTATDVDLTAADRPSREVSITIGSYDDVWIPTYATLNEVSFDGDRSDVLAETLYFNEKAQTALTTAGLDEGDSYSLDVTMPEPVAEGEYEHLQFAELQLPPNAPISPQIAQIAKEYVDSGASDYEKMMALTTYLREGGYFSHGLEGDTPAYAGHGSKRLTEMFSGLEYGLDDPTISQSGMIGDAEQYAALGAVMARSQGIPARAVMGFEIPDGSDGGAVDVTGDDVTAWVEVAFDGVGWVPFDPVPEEDEQPQVQVPKETEVEKPVVQQPPPPPVEPPLPPPAASADEVDQDDEEDEDEQPSAVRRIALVAGVPLGLIGLVVAAVIGAKAVRRSRRMRAPTPDARFTGGWSEVLDRATDLGTPVPARLTRREASEYLARTYPEAGIGHVAATADAGVFGPGDAPDQAVDAFWKDVGTSVAGMSGTHPLLRRLRGRLSLRSLRPGAARSGAARSGAARPGAAGGTRAHGLRRRRGGTT